MSSFTHSGQGGGHRRTCRGMLLLPDTAFARYISRIYNVHVVQAWPLAEGWHANSWSVPPSFFPCLVVVCVAFLCILSFLWHRACNRVNKSTQASLVNEMSVTKYMTGSHESYYRLQLSPIIKYYIIIGSRWEEPNHIQIVMYTL